MKHMVETETIDRIKNYIKAHSRMNDGCGIIVPKHLAKQLKAMGVEGGYLEVGRTSSE